MNVNVAHVLFERVRLATLFSAQQIRNTFILKRARAPDIRRKGQQNTILKSRHYVYDLVENTNIKKKEPLQLILTNYVDGVGNAGAVVAMSRTLAYKKLLLPQLAVYANEENLNKYKDLIEQEKQENVTTSIHVHRTMNILSCFTLMVRMSQENPWTLEKWHIKASFRQAGIHVPEEAITMPEREISGPDLNKQNKEFYITVTINNRENVKTRCRLLHYTSDETKKLPLPSEFYRYPVKALFPEDQSVLDSLPKHRLLIDSVVE